MSGTEDQAEPEIIAAIASAEEIRDPIGGPIELEDAELTQREALLEVSDLASIWRTPNGETFASVPVEGHVEHHALNSRAFRNWMLGELARRYTRKGRPASATANAVRDVLMGLEARSLAHLKQHEAPLRVAEDRGSIYIDLGTTDWSAVKVTDMDWSIVSNTPVPILRGKRTGPFPMPTQVGNFKPLRKLLGRLSDDDFILLVAWTLSALFPHGPYPILILGGEAGAGKSTLARLVQRITDPIHGDLLQPPGDDRDLIAAARHNRVLAYDNLSGIRAELADSFCRLATGSEIGGRALYSDHETASFSAARPLILNGIPDLAARGDLSDRSIVLRLEPLKGHVTERDWWKSAEAILPSVFGALLHALTVGLTRLESVPTPDVRMADFAKLVIAAEPALPWNAGEFLTAYERCRGRSTVSIVEGDLVAAAIRTFANEHLGGWSGLVSELYQDLTAQVPLEAKRTGEWPGNPRWFSDRLRRAAPSLRALGIVVSERRDAHGMKVTIGGPAALATSPTTARAVNDTHCVADVASGAKEQACDAPQQVSWSARV
jgi:hypothetical protein